MGRKRTPGLYKRKGIWHIDKKVFKQRLSESTGSGEIEEAEKYLARRIEELRQAKIYGVRPKRTFTEAATRFLMENQDKRSIGTYASYLKYVVEHIGDLTIDAVHMGSLQNFIQTRRQQQVKARTINYGLQAIRRILNLAATEWVDENGLTWLATAPKIKLLSMDDAKKPYPLNWDEQEALFRELPPHLRGMALFAVNTGCRDQEICKLRWEWEIKLPELKDLLVFIIPQGFVKNNEDRLIVCNDVAKSVIEGVRGVDPFYVFTYKGKPVTRMLNSAWMRARSVTGLGHVRVHDLKHTFGRRLRAAGVSFEDRQDLLGHRSGRITTHYSGAELDKLYLASNRVCEKNNGQGVVLTLLRTNHSRTNGSNKVTGVY